MLNNFYSLEVLITKHIPMSRDQLEKLLWSIAFPGFGQLLNGKIIKGLLLIFLEFLINTQANFNQIIILSFQGRIDQAVQYTDYRWLMFYPCLYLFAIWDSYRDATGVKAPYSYMPFVVSAYSTTVGLIYSSSLSIMGKLWGPVWLPMLFCLIGIFVGLIIQIIITGRIKNTQNP